MLILFFSLLFSFSDFHCYCFPTFPHFAMSKPRYGTASSNSNRL